MSISNTTNIDAAIKASQYLSQTLHDQGKAYQQPMLQLYTTSILLIICIHLIFAYQWSQRNTRQDVVASYRDVVIRKQFHKALIATLSHPASDSSAVSSYAYTPMYERNSSSAVPMGDDSEIHTRRTSTISNEIANILSSRSNMMEKMKAALRPLVDGKLSGLPLLAYVSHIIWQCRPLEEFFDYASDRQYASLHHPTFNVTTIIAADSVIQQTFHAGSDHTSASKSEESYRYHRVIIALMFTSLCLDLLVTHLVAGHFKGLISRSNSSGQQTLDRAMDRGICSLTPLCTALLVMYTEYFPHTSISVLPCMNTTRIGITSSVLGYILSYIILSLLSHRSYPLMGVLCGSMSGILWINGLTKFLAGAYSGNCLILFLALLFALSYKVQYLSVSRTRRTLPGIDWFPCIEKVLWDENGHIRDDE